MSSRRATSSQVMTLAEALDWIAKTLEEPKGSLTADTPRSEIAAWDSLGQLILMSALDEELDVRLESNELSSLFTVGDILAVLARHRRLQQP